MAGEQPAAPPPRLPPPPAKPPPNPSATTIASLGDDILLEILLRLPSLPALVRAALACRSWLRAVRSSPSFRRLFRALHPPPLLGLFLDPDGPAVPAFAPARGFEPDLMAALRQGDFLLTSLLQKDDASSGWQVTDCRGGYILLWNPLDWGLASLNPMTWAVDFLPMPPSDIEVDSFGEFAFLGFHLLSSDEDPWSFSIICVCRDELRVRAAIFSSETWDWIIHSWVDIGGDKRPMLKTGTLVDGSIYWPYDGEGRMMTLNTATMKFSCVYLPWQLEMQGYNFKAGETKDGELCVVYAFDFLLLVWTPRVDCDGIERWVPQKIFSLSADVGWITGGLRDSYRGLEVVEVRAGYVYLATVEMFHGGQLPCWFFSLCLETMKLERLFQWRVDGHVYPYMMAWPPSLVADDESFEHEDKVSQ